MKCNCCERDLTNTEHISFCNDCYTKMIKKHKATELLYKNSEAVAKNTEQYREDHYKLEEERKDNKIHTTSLIMACCLFGLFSAYVEGQFNDVWYNAVFDIIITCLGSCFVFGGVGLILSVIIHYIIDKFKTK